MPPTSLESAFRLITTAMLLIACSGKSPLRQPAPDGSLPEVMRWADTAEGAGIMTGGATGVGGNASASGGQGGTADTSGGAGGTASDGPQVAAEAGSPDGTTESSSDARCDLNSLWGLLSRRLEPIALGPQCVPVEKGGRYLVFDDSGRIVDDTGFCCTGSDGPDKETWLNEVADLRWPCLAGQNVPYTCSIGS
jgi:hypothetical protein